MFASSRDGRLDLAGPGAAYVRVSDDQQDTKRQYEAIRAFEQRHGVTIPKQYWFKDEGWTRDTADRRPDFQRLMHLAEEGRIKWIVVSERDRFGTADADEFVHYRYLLRKYGCRLYDAHGTDWTRKDIATVITAVVDGEKSEQEQHGISKRTLGGKVAKVKEGEWQGGPVGLGLDVACYSRETGKELWRVVTEGLHLRLKVYPDGRTERFDGQGNFPKSQEKTEVLRVAASRDHDKIGAVVNVFRRYATESISFTALAPPPERPGLPHCLRRLLPVTPRRGHARGPDLPRVLHLEPPALRQVSQVAGRPAGPRTELRGRAVQERSG
jgi:DNA invertase Pin-like site-specific DNA recombinase